MLAIRVNLRGNRSLKDKRRVIRSAIARTQAKFKVTAAEVGDQDRHDTGLLGVACISNDRSHLDSVLDKILNYVASNSPESEIYAEYRELIQV